jgi:hypothetical protein
MAWRAQPARRCYSGEKEMTQKQPRTGRSFGATMKAIAWSFVGLRRKSDFDQDVAGGMNPLYVIGCALLGTAIFIGAIITVVRIAVSQA